MKRFYWGLAGSVVLHILLVYTLPGLSEPTTEPQPNQEITVQLQSTPTTEDETVESSPAETQETTRDQPSVKSQQQEDVTSADPPAEPVSDPDQKAEPSQSDEPRDRQSDATPPEEEQSSTEQAPETKEPPPQEEPNSTTEQSSQRTPDDESEDPLLTRGGRFGTAPDDDAGGEPTSRESELSAEPTNRYTVNESSRDSVPEITPPEVVSATENQPATAIQFESTEPGNETQWSLQNWDLPTQSSERPSYSRNIINRELPEVPGWLERQGEDVKVTIQYTIDRSGTVSSMELLKSSGYSELDGTVMNSLQQWRWEPAENSSKRVIVFRFQLRAGGEQNTTR